jgi:hypothetical protein
MTKLVSSSFTNFRILHTRGYFTPNVCFIIHKTKIDEVTMDKNTTNIQAGVYVFPDNLCDTLKRIEDDTSSPISQLHEPTPQSTPLLSALESIPHLPPLVIPPEPFNANAACDALRKGEIIALETELADGNIMNFYLTRSHKSLQLVYDCKTKVAYKSFLSDFDGDLHEAVKELSFLLTMVLVQCKVCTKYLAASDQPMCFTCRK